MVFDREVGADETGSPVGDDELSFQFYKNGTEMHITQNEPF